ncbi:MAG: hypothetical protein QXN01_00100 [Candidatus Anstonellales archaeon]
MVVQNVAEKSDILPVIRKATAALLSMLIFLELPVILVFFCTKEVLLDENFYLKELSTRNIYSLSKEWVSGVAPTPYNYLVSSLTPTYLESQSKILLRNFFSYLKKEKNSLELIIELPTPNSFDVDRFGDGIKTQIPPGLVPDKINLSDILFSDYQTRTALEQVRSNIEILNLSIFIGGGFIFVQTILITLLEFDFKKAARKVGIALTASSASTTFLSLIMYFLLPQVIYGLFPEQYTNIPLYSSLILIAGDIIAEISSRIFLISLFILLLSAALLALSRKAENQPEAQKKMLRT